MFTLIDTYELYVHFLMEHPDGLSLLYSTPPGSMHPKIPLGWEIETFPGSVVKHQEWRQFTPHDSETPQIKYTNVYYHCKPEYVWLRNLTVTVKNFRLKMF